MGLPISKLIIGSNHNDILVRTLQTGIMKAETVRPSLTPSMDIQISSNFERILFEIFHKNAKKLSKTMEIFQKTGVLRLPPAQHARLKRSFVGVRASDEQTIESMQTVFRETGIVVDPHSAVGIRAARQAGCSHQPIIAMATAHPAKFSDTVARAVGVKPLETRHKNLFAKTEHYTRLPPEPEQVRLFIRKKLRSMPQRLRGF